MSSPYITLKYRVYYVVVVDSHIQRIVLTTQETMVTQQVSHRPIKYQFRLWAQRGTKVNGSHYGDSPQLRPTGIQIATKSFAALQAMAPTNCTVEGVLSEYGDIALLIVYKDQKKGFMGSN